VRRLRNVTKCDPTPFPGSCGSEPAPCGSEPGTCGFQAGTCGSEPGTSGSEPGTCGYEAAPNGSEAAPCRPRLRCDGFRRGHRQADPGGHALTVDCLGLPERGWVQPLRADPSEGFHAKIAPRKRGQGKGRSKVRGATGTNPCHPWLKAPDRPWRLCLGPAGPSWRETNPDGSNPAAAARQHYPQTIRVIRG
jgi:hypothetical protein